MLAVIGGSGVYNIEGLKNDRWIKAESSFGRPSDEFLMGELGGETVVFLPRHGRGHRLPPTQINYRANIDALKRLGVTDIVSVSAVGSLREHLAPGMFVIVDQFIDRTFAREKSFFGEGLVAHVSMAHPVCARLGEHLQAAAAANINTARGGTYLVMEGPQFSTLAESEHHRARSARAQAQRLTHECVPARGRDHAHQVPQPDDPPLPQAGDHVPRHHHLAQGPGWFSHHHP